MWFTRCWGSCLGRSVCLISADLGLLLLGFGGKFCVKVARKSALSYWHVVLVIFSSSSEAGGEDKPLNSPALLLGGPCLAINMYQSGAGTFCDCSSGACQTPEAWKPEQTFDTECPCPKPECPDALMFQLHALEVWNTDLPTADTQLHYIYL